MFLVLHTPASGAMKISALTRCLAKGVDVAVIVLLSVALPHPAGVLLGLLYTLAHDGLFQGQSPGKRLLHLKVESLKTGAVCSLRESVIRNAPIGVAVFFGIIPFWGWIILVLMGIPLMALEVYLMITLENGGRLGDVMADTRVVEAPRPPPQPPKAQAR